MEDICPECDGKYKKLGCHWRYNPDHRPSFTDYQRDVITGLLMGDGSLNRSSSNPHLGVQMITPNYLQYIDQIFGCIGTGVKFSMTAAESAERNRDSGLRPTANENDYSDVYRWQTRCHPELHEFNWYKTGEKVWPEDIELTPTVLKHWYCGDGHWANNAQNSCVSIAMSNEMENKDKINKYFRKVGLPEPSNYIGCKAEFTKEQSHKLWEYMGEPLPDFEYKWPERYR